MKRYWCLIGLVLTVLESLGRFSSLALLLSSKINKKISFFQRRKQGEQQLLWNKKRSSDDVDGDHKKWSEGESPLDKAIRKARAKAEISRLTTGPEGITDMEDELKKLTSVSSGIPLGSHEAETEETLQLLETSMSRAIASGDFSLAASECSKIDQMHIDDCGLVLQANVAFYQAFSDKDYDAMTHCWMENNSIQCIHPSKPPLKGYSDVLNSFKTMFATTDASFRLNTVHPTNVNMNVKGSTAWITCDEEVYAPTFVRGVGSSKKLVTKVTATNIFHKIDSKWFLVHHHATWHKDSPSSSTSQSNPSISRLTGTNASDPKSSSSTTVKRVFMGSLSDLLSGGGLSDILSNSDKPLGSDDADTPKTIIQLNAFDDDDDEDDSDENTNNDFTLDESVLSKQFAKMSSASTTNSKSTSTDKLRQNCVSLLRKLCTQGSISQNQKRLLLTDIISNSAKGEYSNVEMAYDLLMMNDVGIIPPDNSAEEEFADQCRVFASLLSETSPPSSST